MAGICTLPMWAIFEFAKSTPRARSAPSRESAPAAPQETAPPPPRPRSISTAWPRTAKAGCGSQTCWAFDTLAATATSTAFPVAERRGLPGDDPPAGTSTAYSAPTGIALLAAGDVIIADTGNSRIRKLQPNDPVKMDIVSGNSQKGITGTALDALIVKLTGKAGVPAGGVSVAFAVTSGSADLDRK